MKCFVMFILIGGGFLDLIELLFEDRVRLFEEKKKFEEEVSKLRGSSFVFLSYVVIVLEFYGVCVFEFLGEIERLVMEI